MSKAQQLSFVLLPCTHSSTALLIIVFLSVGSLTAWMFDESHIPQGVSDVSTARELLNKQHLEMAIAGLVAGGIAILVVDELKKRRLG
jgi:hypothetical protein